jgi:hypothetical protein
MPIATALCVNGCRVLEIPREGAVIECPSCKQRQRARVRRGVDKNGDAFEDWSVVAPPEDSGA